TVTKLSTNDNTTIDNLITDLNSALPGSINTLVQFVRFDNRVQLVATSPTVKRVQVTTSTVDPASVELGLPTTLATTVFLSVVPASVKVSSNVDLQISVNGAAGFTSITLRSGTTGTAATGGNGTLTDLVNDINESLAGSSLAGQIVAARSGDSLILTAID